MDRLVRETPLVFLDVETTGLDPFRGDRIVEIALLRVIGGEPVDQASYLVNPQRHIPSTVVQVHHITDEMVREKPDFGDIAADVQRITEGAILVGHNVLFDIAFVSREFKLAGHGFAWCSALDTLRLARRVLGQRRNGLQALVRAIPLDISAQAHRAMGDVLATWRLFEYMGAQLDGAFETIDQLEALQGGKLQPGAEQNQRFKRYPRPTAPLKPPAQVAGKVSILQDAIERGLDVEIEYKTQGGMVSKRLITPHRLEQQTRNYVCVRAYCHTRQDRRTFRLDRIISLRVIEG